MRCDVVRCRCDVVRCGATQCDAMTDVMADAMCGSEGMGRDGWNQDGMGWDGMDGRR